MKKSFIAMGLAVAAISFAGCNKVELADNNFEEVKAGQAFELVAGTQMTKTTDNGTATLWAANDALAVFHAEAGTTTYGSNDQFTITEANLEAGTFTGTLTEAVEAEKSYDWYAIYPYNTNYTTPANTTCYQEIKNKQTQAGYGSTAHLSGANFPLVGKATSVSGADTPSITMKQVCSVIKLEVTNNSGEDLYITSASITSSKVNIAGGYFIDFSGDAAVLVDEDAEDETKSKYMYKTVDLTVTGGTAIADGAKAVLYIGVRPFVANNETLKLAVNGYEKDLVIGTTDVTFAAGKMKNISFNYDKEPEVDYVSLPWSWEGGVKADFEAITGVTANGLGADYADAHGDYRIKFDNTGDYIVIKTDSAIGVFSIGVKMAGGATASSLNVMGSVNGADYTSVQTFEIKGKQNDILSFSTTEEFDSAYRFVKVMFNKGSNVAIGPMSISAVDTTPSIAANDITGVAPIGVEGAKAAYVAKNFTDDVEVKAFTGCVTAAEVVNGEIVYTVATNYSAEAAAGTIVLQSAADNSVTKTINVSQLNSDLSVSDLVITIPYDAASATFNLTSKDMGWNVAVSPATDMNLSVDKTSGNAAESAQTITVSSTTEAIEDEAITLGTIVVYRNGNTDDVQKKTITVKKDKAPSADAKYYVKTSTITAGQYLFVVGSKAASSTGTSLNMANVTISNDKILSDSTVDAYAITVAEVETGKYSLKMGSDYIGYGSSTSLKKGDTVSDNSFKWTITVLSDGSVEFINVGTNTRFIGYNGTGALKAYATSNFGSYPCPTLYKFTE